jgi:osmotically-inducible protein OsmY
MGKFSLSAAHMLCLSLHLSGCQSVSFISSPIQKRGMSGFFKDNLLRAKIIKALFNQYNGSISTLIHKGHVVLVGYLKTEEDHEKVLHALGALKEIHRLSDHLMVGRPQDDPINDTYLSQSLQSKLFFDVRIRSQNYHIAASHKILYILGTAGSESEKNYVLKHAESMKVRNVISDIQIEQPLEKESAPLP